MNVIAFIQEQQRSFQGQLSEQILAIQQASPLAAVIALMAAGFLYGFFHAVGPGHGKILVSGYMLASRQTLRRALFITAASSLLQAVTAIVLVMGTVYVLEIARAKAEYAAAMLEIVSFLLITLLGLWLAFRGIRQWPRRHAHVHGHDCHAHMPLPQKASDDQDLRSVAAMIASIGIRPCTGALILLFFASFAGVAWAGILGVLAMAAGTALSTSLFAIAALKSRQWALALAESNEIRMARLQSILSIAGGMLVALLGGLFFLAMWDILPDQNLSEAPIAPKNHPLIRPLNQ